MIRELYQSTWSGWKSLDTIHLMINHRYYMDKDSPIKEFDSENIKTYDKTYGFMCREILNRMKNKK